MTIRLLLGVALVANVLVLVICSGQSTQATTTNVSSASTTSSLSSSHPFSSSSSKPVGKSKPRKCRKVKKCSKNEEFSSCPQSLQRAQNCSEKAESSAYRAEWDKPCKEGCVCKENYLRAENGTCILADQCPLICGANEVLNDCPNACESDHCPTDEEDTLAKPCVASKVCLPACRCAFNHHRAANGTCIPTRECPTINCSSGPNQEYDTCPPLCPTDDCSQASPTGECPRQFGNILIILPCNPKCRCIKDYWRLDGICVPYGECPGVCPDNERYSTCVQAECRALNCTQKDQSIPCIRMDPQFCKTGCVCEEGYLRNKDGVCVLEDKCEPCPVNEEFVPCIQGVCRAKNCSERGQDVPCPDIPEEECDSGYICKEGFLRAEDGTCVPEDRCELKKCPKNEEFSYCPQSLQRAQNCSEKAEPSTYRPESDTPCKEGCVCKESYLRAENGTCISADQCPLTCGANEVLDDCPMTCESDYCPIDEEDTLSKPCVAPQGCPPPVCKCAFNHLRAVNGTCIPTSQCPTIDCSSEPNQEYDTCPPLCPTDDCSQASPTGECPPQFGNILIVLPCNPKCRCIKDYWRLDGICVPYGECPGVCLDNERYSTCVQAECRALNCTQKDQSVPCIRMDPQFCQKGCVCEEGYLRNKDGICVLEDKCEPPTCPVNEEFSECTQIVCRAQKCIEKDWPIGCPSIASDSCIKGCVCQNGYLRDESGLCIQDSECKPNPCKPNEEFSNCTQAICRTLNCSDQGKPQVCPLVAEGDCETGCVCQEGYLRTEEGYCVPTDNCDVNKCPLFEEWSDCANAACKPQNCTQKGLPVVCPFVTECVPGCLCRDNYLRDESGFCVYEDDCTTAVCPDNERYSTSVQAECRALNCTQKDQSVPCIRMDPQFCQKGCVCEEGYLRNKDGICVLEDKCEPHVCSANEEWSKCAQATCRAQNCIQRGKPIACPAIEEGFCEEACVCKAGFLRNASGDCIPEDECPCGENEVLDDCPQMCNTDYCPLSDGEEQVCTQADPCVPACKCRLNHKRAINGTCIPTRDCPPFECNKRNEEYVSCPPYCPTDECGKPRLLGRCPFRIGVLLQCKPKCQCKDGYGRDNGTCVPLGECPDICPINEVYSPCVQQTCRPQNCSYRDLVMETCPACDAAECQRGCVCKENYYRNDKGHCISYEECGGPTCPNAHEVFDPYFTECPSNTCGSLTEKFATCDENQKVGPGCRCEPGYLRSKLNEPCIPICDCDQMKYSADCPK